jgi:NAD(P)-dependent dehydrogenase (short-subunit alcohol dehydrogenase family)
VSAPAGTIDLHGRVVFITGGSRGIGAAAVRALHRAGAAVFFTYRERTGDARALRDELGERVEPYRLDVAQTEALQPALDACAARYGERLDVLINNAAIFADNPFDGDDFAAWRAGWRRTFDVNLFAAADLAYLAMRRMRAQGEGTIVNVASRAAHRGELTYADYGASKAALVNLTKSIARSCAPHGIVAIAIAPGFVATDMVTASMDEHGAAISGEVPLGRIGDAEEVAHAIAFACTPLARYLNGSTIDLNGGSYVR